LACALYTICRLGGEVGRGAKRGTGAQKSGSSYGGGVGGGELGGLDRS
jgi:hypothetical protein